MTAAWTTTAPMSTMAQKKRALISGGLAVGATTLFAVMSFSRNSNALLEKGTEEEKEQDSSSNVGHNKKNPIEINLMDKISHKVYLNPSRAKNWQPADTSSAGVTLSERPLGVPSTLRILAIDLTEMRQEAFSHGECRVAFDRVYPDGIAPPQKVERNNTRNHSGGAENNKKHHLEVEQKTWVKSLIRCMQKDLPESVGVEMMEASFADLNPRNLRKTRQLGGYHYDPGKYTKPDATAASGTTASSSSSTDPKTKAEKYHQEEVPEEDELDAPWNQYAWLEELKMRIYGFVAFGDPLEPASRWSRLITGSPYKATVPSQRSILQLLVPPFLQSNPEGIDGGDSRRGNNTNNNNNLNNWASNKPHAVIANGAAVQRMPSGLRLLQKTCRDANVPLFVLYDPRAWGGNTHQTLHQALLDVRGVVKQNIILNAMELQSGFSRGRQVGRMEQYAKQLAQQAKDDRQRRQDALRRRQWHKLDAMDLEKRLMEYGVMRKQDRVEDGKTYRQYTPAMVEISRQCVKDIEENEEDGQGGGDDAPTTSRTVAD